MRKLIFLIWVLFLSLSLFAEPVIELSINEAIELALKNNTGYLISKEEVRQSKFTVRKSFGFLPQVTIEGGRILDEKLMEICKHIRDLSPKAVIFPFGYGRLIAYCGQRPTVITNTGGNTADLFYVKRELLDLPLIERFQKYNVTHVVTKINNEWTLQSVDEHIKSYL